MATELGWAHGGGGRITLIGTEEIVARELRNAADRFWDLADLREILAKV